MKASRDSIHSSGVVFLEYTLPDAGLAKGGSVHPLFLVWQPREPCLVLGASNDETRSLKCEQVIWDHIPVYRRPSGGEAIYLSPFMLAISIRFPHQAIEAVTRYFQISNQLILSTLAHLGVSGLEGQGISDITLNNRKILGSAIYQNRDMLLYQGIINVSEAPAIFNRFLKHPPREPAYRSRRPHDSFVTSLAQQGYPIDLQALKKRIESSLDRYFFPQIIAGSP